MLSPEDGVPGRQSQRGRHPQAPKQERKGWGAEQGRDLSVRGGRLISGERSLAPQRGPVLCVHIQGGARFRLGFMRCQQVTKISSEAFCRGSKRAVLY